MTNNRKRAVKHGRMANVFRHRKFVGSQDRHDQAGSKARHPSRAIPVRRNDTDLEQASS